MQSCLGEEPSREIGQGGLRYQMLDKRVLSTVALTIVLAIAPAEAKEEAATPRKPYLGTFATSVLAGGSTNELTVPVSPEDLQLLPENDSQGIAIQWSDRDKEQRHAAMSAPAGDARGF
jgi:hypothetical protein